MAVPIEQNTAISTTPPTSTTGQFLSIFKELSATQKIISLAVVVIVLGGLLTLIIIGGAVNHKVLFSGLAKDDAAEVITWLKEQRIPYTLSTDGRSILIPAAQVYETRLNLAGANLPRGGGVGFEIFDTVGLGTTDFIHQMNYRRALQGELARTIRQFQQIQEARVHIATPKESIFIEDERPTTASVSVKLRGRDTLSTTQIKSIVNLVASAVPGLSTDNITLVDTVGRLLYRAEQGQDFLMSDSHLEHQFTLEQKLRHKIETMLEKVVGINRVRAQVSADLDFNRISMTEEIFDPDAQIIRSEQLLTEEDFRSSQTAQGIPGVKGELATFVEAGGAEANQGDTSRRNSIVRNYEINRQTRHTQKASGGINRLSVAVMIDGTYERIVDEEGNITLQYQPRTANEMLYFEKMVKNTIGYNADRGDQVEVVSMEFALSAMPEPIPDAMAKWRELAEWLAMPLVYLFIAIGLLLFVVKPFFKLLATKQIENQTLLGAAAQIAIEQGEEELALAPKHLTDQERMYRLAQSDPARAADLVRRWLREEN